MQETTVSSPIYQRLRWRLTLWYVLLSGITSVALVVLGTWLCYTSINDSLDKTLEDMIATNLPEVEIVQNRPQFHSPGKQLSTEWAKRHSTVQLYDKDGKFIDEFGPPGIRNLELEMDYFEGDTHGVRVRATSDPVKAGDTVVGYIQAEVPVEIRDKSTLQFATIMACIMPVLLLVLGLSGFLFSGKASRPAEQAFMLLKQFMADASHELRTPVHAIQLTAENVAAESESNAQLVKDMEAIVGSTDRMGRLIDDMLMLTKMELQQMPLKHMSVALDKVATQSVNAIRPLFAEKQLDLQLGTMDPAVVEGDSDALYRVVTNLLQNALRYTDSGGGVTVEVKSSGDSVRLSVADSGIGIDAESLPHIFDRFYRVDKSRARAAGGSGLGLSIVKAICEHHKGTITVQSQEGKGTTFTAVFPRLKAQTGSSTIC